VKQGVRPSPEPDPRLSLESLEQQLRALPPPVVPESLPSKLIATIPPAKAAASLATSIIARWPWIAGVAVLCITVPAVFYSWQMHGNPKPGAESSENRDPMIPSTGGKDVPASSKAVRNYEQAVRIDPYNADAWFSLAKAQANVHRPDNAISAAQKAIDIARSRNRSDLASTIEAWMRSYRAAQSDRSPP
jgi:tetratricopeptide (TPR) repeat protein